jgi:hypothetical protein
MHTVVHDVRYACRLLLRQPGTTAAIVLTLALGMGATTAVFSVVHTALLRPLPNADPDRLVMVWEKRAAEGAMRNAVSPADFLDWTRTSRSFAAMAAYEPSGAHLSGAGEPIQLVAGFVTGAYIRGRRRC